MLKGEFIFDNYSKGTFIDDKDGKCYLLDIDGDEKLIKKEKKWNIKIWKFKIIGIFCNLNCW